MACDNQQNEKLKIQPLKKKKAQQKGNKPAQLTVKRFIETFQRVQDLLGAAPCNNHLAKPGRV